MTRVPPSKGIVTKGDRVRRFFLITTPIGLGLGLLVMAFVDRGGDPKPGEPMELPRGVFSHQTVTYQEMCDELGNKEGEELEDWIRNTPISWAPKIMACLDARKIPYLDRLRRDSEPDCTATGQIYVNNTTNAVMMCTSRGGEWEEIVN